MDIAAYSDPERDFSDPDKSFDQDSDNDQDYAGYTEDECFTAIWDFIEHKKPFLRRKFFPTKDSLKDHAPGVGTMFENLRKRGASDERAMEFLILSLYDVVILADDSFSMKVKENGKRKETLQSIVSLIADIYTLARPKGIVSLKFFNNPPGYKNITPGKVEKAIKSHLFSGVTRIGSELQLKILNQYAQLKSMTKPLLVMIITDGTIEGEDPNLLRDVIVDCVVKMHKDGNDPEASQAIGFHFSRIGKDKDAKKLLEELDDDTRIGRYIDCLPANMPLEKLAGVKPGAPLSDDQWEALAKMLLGGILDTWDNYQKLSVQTSKGQYESLEEQKILDHSSDVELEEDVEKDVEEDLEVDSESSSEDEK